MSENNVTELSEEIRKKLKALREVKKLSDNDDWTIPQIILQDIQADQDVKEALGDPTLPLTEQILLLKKRIEEEFKDEIEIKNIIMDSIPTYAAINSWTKTKDWQNAVMNRIRNSHTFKNVNRTKVLENIFKLATTANSSSIKAAELYFKLEGSLNKENKDSNNADDVFDRFKDLQKTLHNKK